MATQSQFNDEDSKIIYITMIIFGIIAALLLFL